MKLNAAGNETHTHTKKRLSEKKETRKKIDRKRKVQKPVGKETRGKNQ